MNETLYSYSGQSTLVFYHLHMHMFYFVKAFYSYRGPLCGLVPLEVGRVI